MSTDNGTERPGDDKDFEIPSWEAEFDLDRMYEIERCYTEQVIGQCRRGLLGLLTLDSEKLYDACEEAPDAFFAVFEKSVRMIDQCRWMLELLEAAHSRLMIGLCGVDTDAKDAPFSKDAFQAVISSTAHLQRGAA